MAIYDIPVKPVHNQRLTVVLSGESVVIKLTSRLGRIYADVSVAGVDVVLGRLCQNRTPIILERYRGFQGDLYFEDLQGTNAPTWDGLGVRYVLRWVSDV